MRWTSKVVNTRENNVSRVDNLMFTSWGQKLFYYNETTLKMFITWMFCFAEDKKIISSIENTITEPDWKKKTFSTHFGMSGIVDRVTTYCFPLHYICLCCSPGCLPHQQIFSKTSKLSYYFYMVKYYVRYNNMQL
jgi:hypothetical protein